MWNSIKYYILIIAIILSNIIDWKDLDYTIEDQMADQKLNQRATMEVYQ